MVAVLAASPYAWDFGAPLSYRDLYARGFLVTIQASAAAFVIGLTLGLGVGLARGSRVLAIRHLADLYVEVIRGTPFIVQISIAYFGIASLLGVDSKFWVGVLALGVFAAAYIGEILRAGIESIDRGQREAARSLGLSRGQALRYVILPQAVRRVIPPLTSELLALTKESSLLFAIGLAELMAAARQVGAATYRNFEALLVVAGLYLTITLPLSFLARRLERMLARGQTQGGHL